MTVMPSIPILWPFSTRNAFALHLRFVHHLEEDDRIPGRVLRLDLLVDVVVGVLRVLGLRTAARREVRQREDDVHFFLEGRAVLRRDLQHRAERRPREELLELLLGELPGDIRFRRESDLEPHALLDRARREPQLDTARALDRPPAGADRRLARLRVLELAPLEGGHVPLGIMGST
jgi:hypothetical protein